MAQSFFPDYPPISHAEYMLVRQSAGSTAIIVDDRGWISVGDVTRQPKRIMTHALLKRWLRRRLRNGKQ